MGFLCGARDPYLPKDRTISKIGAISAVRAKLYVITDTEKELGETLYMAEDVVIHVEKARPYNSNKDINFADIDTNVSVYPIRGSLNKYSCDPIYQDNSNLNHNSFQLKHRKAK